MADDLDNLLRAAMKTLDEQVPSGYFEALPNQTLARLEGSMQQGSSGSTTETRDNVAPPVVASTNVEPALAPVAKQQAMDERDEDSGLHDIRNLAQSTKQRLSSKRNSTSPPVADDVLASSSGSFKNIALPQPANMVSLPAVDELPSKADVAAAEKAAKEAAKRAAKEKKAEPAAAVAAVESVAHAPAAVAPSIERKAFSLPSQQRKGSKGPVLAILGLGLAAAAGGVIYMQTSKQDAAPAAAEQASVDTGAGSAVAAAPAPAPAVTAEPIAVAEEPAPAEPAKEEVAAAPAQIAADDTKASDAAETKAKKKSAKGGKQKADTGEAEPKVEVKAPEKVDTKKPAPAKGGEAEGEPSFDALLKEAGVTEKKEAKPVLEKKSLTGDDFKKGIGAVTPKAKGCYKGTQGTAMVKLTVAPSGSISKVAVTGEFAGKPEAACVESAIKAATFPPWDGGPQSFTYSVLLSD
jgi:hypothetical protein